MKCMCQDSGKWDASGGNAGDSVKVVCSHILSDQLSIDITDFMKGIGEAGHDSKIDVIGTDLPAGKLEGAELEGSNFVEDETELLFRRFCRGTHFLRSFPTM